MNDFELNKANRIYDKETAEFLAVIQIEKHLSSAAEPLTRDEVDLQIELIKYHTILKFLCAEIDKIKQERMAALKKVYGDNLSVPSAADGGK